MASSLARWTSQEAFTWYESRPWLVGFNYVPTYACNTTEWWQQEATDCNLIDRELRWAADIGYNTTRVFLQYLVWRHDPQAFRERLGRFLALAAGHGLSVMPVLFDDCAFGEPPQIDPYLGKQRAPVPGMILPSWTPSPGRTLAADPTERPRLREYVLDILGSFSRRDGVVAWDLYNEPMNVAAAGTPAFLEEIFGWAREANPPGPVTIGVWNDNQAVNEVIIVNSDIITFHAYTDAAGLVTRIAEFKSHGRPVICTEWMARAAGSRFETDLPIFRRERGGCYQWGLINGRTQCQFPWWNKPGGSVDEKTGWFHDILRADGTPYRQSEVDAIRAILSQENPSSPLKKAS